MKATEGNAANGVRMYRAPESEESSHLLDRIAPDLRIPLTSVIGSLELLNNGSLGDMRPYQQRILSVAAKNAQQLSAMLEDVFFLAHVDSGAFSLVRSETELSEVVNNSAALAQNLYAEHEHQWKIELANDAFVLADAVHLQRALGNLMTNAARFTNAHGTITVQGVREHGHCVIQIKDNGIGISESDVGRLGDRFFRSATSQRANLDGMGLGFVVAKTIIEHHDGAINVSSSNDGTLVEVLLPAISVDKRLSA